MFEAVPRWKRLLASLAAIIVGDLVAAAALTLLMMITAPLSCESTSFLQAVNTACMIAIGSSPFVAIGTILLALVDYGLTRAHIGIKARMIVLPSSASVLGCMIIVVFTAFIPDPTNSADAAVVMMTGAGFGAAICASQLIGERLLIRQLNALDVASIGSSGRDEIPL